MNLRPLVLAVLVVLEVIWCAQESRVVHVSQFLIKCTITLGLIPAIRPSEGCRLLGDDTAGDAVSGIARGISHHIVGMGVDDEGCAAVGEE